MESSLALLATTSSEETAARGCTYHLLARLWLREVDRSLLRELGSPSLRDSFLGAGGSLPVCDDIRTIEELEIDFCRLFVGPKNHLPPFQSVWQSGQFQSATTASMRSFIELVGYPIDRLPSGMMADHFGVQLDVMGHILQQFSTWRSDPDGLEQVLELANAFFTGHLLWAAELLSATLGRAATEFYRSSALLTRDFLNSEMRKKPSGPECKTLSGR